MKSLLNLQLLFIPAEVITMQIGFKTKADRKQLGGDSKIVKS
jgi:hypothetical protein